jgi:leucyl/phenylalanyl-tRNA--protein transferase
MDLVWLNDASTSFPEASRAWGPMSEAPGLLAAGGDLSIERLEAAYRHGIFPWYGEEQPILWWSPDPRMVLQTRHFHLSHSLRKTLRRFARDAACAIRVDSAFEEVLRTCATIARAQQVGTWIVPEMIEAYARWHAAGRVHSFEVWREGELVGGLYGVGLGAMFFGESMFSRRSGASKIALAALVAFCRRHGIEWIDCQQRTNYLASMGAAEVPRGDFLAHLARACDAAPPSQWTFTPEMWSEVL